MAKRFTDTNKWDKAWFRKLPIKYKAFWFFILDRCDHAGVWDIDLDSAKHFTGASFDMEGILSYFQGKIMQADNDHLVIIPFTSFQYGSVQFGSKCAKSAHKRLCSLGIDLNLLDPIFFNENNSDLTLKEPLANPYVRVKDKDKDKDNINILNNYVSIIYGIYPRKAGKKRGVAIIEKTIKTAEQQENLKKAVENYAEYCKTQATEEKFIKHFSTFMGEWEDWIVMPETVDNNKLDKDYWDKVYN